MLELLRITKLVLTIFVLEVWLKSCRCPTAIKAKVLLSELLAHIVLLKGEISCGLILNFHVASRIFLFNHVQSLLLAL